MARKFPFDNSITKDIMSAAADSFADSIEMIENDKLIPSEFNFYSIDEIDSLADDIERQGLKHNLVVYKNPEKIGTFIIKSGHRRFAAINKLISEGRRTSKTIPCIIDGNKSDSETKLDLIMLNFTTRVISDKEMLQQFDIIKDLYEKLESEGKKIPGRMREKISNALKISPAQVGKIENIKNNAVDEVISAVKNGEMSISTANEIAKLDTEKQVEILDGKPAVEIKHKDIKNISTNIKNPPKIANKSKNLNETFDFNSKNNKQTQNHFSFQLSAFEVILLKEFLCNQVELSSELENFKNRLLECKV